MPLPVLTRRCYVAQWTPAERAIKEAIKIVEAAGSDASLTDAVMFLDKAFGRVADFVDGALTKEYQAPPPYPEEERAPGFRSEWLSTFCSVCDCRQFTAPGGATCAHGHGGAEGIYPKEIP